AVHLERSGSVAGRAPWRDHPGPAPRRRQRRARRDPRHHREPRGARMNVADTLTQGRRDHPDRAAILFDGEAISYAALDRAASRLARTLCQAGVDRGDRVALLLPNVPAFVDAYFGTLKIGAIAVSINTGLSAPEVRYILEDSGAAVLITTSDLR